MQKKAQVSSLAPAIIAMILAAFVLVTGLIMLQALRDVDSLDQELSITNINETVASVSETGTQVADVDAAAFNNFAISECINATTGDVIPTTNYTIIDVGYIAFTAGADAAGANNSDWNCTYSYTAGGSAFLGTNKTLVGLATFGSFWEIIVLAIVITIVIGLLLTVFGGRRAR